MFKLSRRNNARQILFTYFLSEISQQLFLPVCCKSKMNDCFYHDFFFFNVKSKKKISSLVLLLWPWSSCPSHI